MKKRKIGRITGYTFLAFLLILFVCIGYVTLILPGIPVPDLKVALTPARIARGHTWPIMWPYAWIAILHATGQSSRARLCPEQKEKAVKNLIIQWGCRVNFILQTSPLTN